MARVLIVDRAGRGTAVADALSERGYAVRQMDGEGFRPGDVVDALDAVAVVCWLMAEGKGHHPEVNGEQLETVLLKVVDTGVRGFVFERPVDTSPNQLIEHARATWHLSVSEVDAGNGHDWTDEVVAAVDASLGID